VLLFSGAQQPVAYRPHTRMLIRAPDTLQNTNGLSPTRRHRRSESHGGESGVHTIRWPARVFLALQGPSVRRSKVCGLAHCLQLPFNNACHTQKSTISNVGVSNFGLEMPRAPTKHVHKTLPPTLSGFPGEAEIRYFVKATVARHSFFKENARAYVPFNFFPIEAPRPPVSGSQVYARQKHAFTGYAEAPKKEKMKSMFGMKSSTPAPSVTGPTDGPFISVDARLPEPAILTCNQDIPLTIIVKRLNSKPDAIYLQSLQVSLIAVTKIRAHEVFRVENNSWIIMSRSNMGVLLPFSSGAEGAEAVVDDALWRGQALPNTVAPTFETCNIARAYTLDVRIGLSYAGATAGGKVRKHDIPRIVRSSVACLLLVCLVVLHTTDMKYSHRLRSCL